MRKLYFFIIIISILLIGISVYIFTQINFNEKIGPDNLIDDSNITNAEYDFISLGDFLEMIILESINDVDYNLIETSVDHYAAPYLSIAENYDVIEKATVTAKMLDERIRKIYALKLCALCDINIRHNEQQEFKNLEMFQIENFTDVEKSLLSHVLAKGFINEASSGDLIKDEFLTNEEASRLLSVYMKNK